MTDTSTPSSLIGAVSRTSGGLEYPSESTVPELCRGEPCLMGIDEAGRGPALGPMVYGTCYCPISQKKQLKDLGFDDSKQLKEATRDSFFSQIQNAVEQTGVSLGWLVISLSSEEISGKMLRIPKYNLNTISHDTAIALIRGVIARGVNLKEVYVDTVGDPKKYEAKLSGLFPDLKIAVRKKADSLFPIVSAASICAKVTRDFIVHNWVFQEAPVEATAGRKFGSGYPSDPNTKRWLASHMDPVFGFPSFVRFSWAPARKAMEKDCVDVDWPHLDSDSDDDDDDDDGGPRQMKLSFGARKPKPAKRPRYFQDRSMALVTGFGASGGGAGVGAGGGQGWDSDFD